MLKHKVSPFLDELLTCVGCEFTSSEGKPRAVAGDRVRSIVIREAVHEAAVFDFLNHEVLFILVMSDTILP